jgi:hypothetical protein
MIRIVSSFFAATLLAVGLGAGAAQAQTRVFVAAQGSDSNPCTFALPCRTFQHAHDTVAANGEIDVLDPAGYGSLTINKAISIQGHGFSGISVASGTGITINGAATDEVNLNGLIIDGENIGSTGIRFNNGLFLTVENCVIRHVTGDGIDLFSSASSNLFVSNTLVADNGAGGIQVSPTGSGTVTAVFNRIEINNNAASGITLTGQFSSGGTINATMSESVASRNGYGVSINSISGEPETTLTLFHSVVANNGNGIASNGANATLTVAQSMVTGNTSAGWNITGSVAQSYGDNYFNGNGANTGSLTLISKQ